MKKRVLIISPKELCVGGVSKVIMTLLQELHKEYSFDLVALSSKTGYYDDVFSAYGGRIYRIPALQYPEHKILHFLSFFQIQSAMRKILKENQYDVIHSHSGCQDAACHMAADCVGVPVRISHGHGTYVWNGRNLIMRSYFWFTKRVIRKYATARLACSAVAGDTLFLGNTYINILNPVDISHYANIERIPHEGINILQIGYFCDNKNQKFSIELINFLRNHGAKIHLSFIGYPSEQNYYSEMLSLIARYHLEQQITFLPHDFDKRLAFAQTDYCILPSESEGLPLAALESQAAGIPCLMSDHISTESDMGAGYFLPYNDLEKWATAIINGVNVDAQKLAHNLQTISTHAYADKIRQVYEQNL